MNIAINGFGRIGRAAFKLMLEKKGDFNIVAINDLTDNTTLAHLLKYDTAYGKYDKNVSADNDFLIVNGKKYRVLEERNPELLPWKDLKVDVVLECTGRFRTKGEASKHIKAGAKKVIISAPAKSDGVKTIVLGVNEDKLNKKDNIVSNASCTTNCLAPITKIIKDNFGIEKALMTTVHSYTADQNLVDGPHKDLRRARAAAQNIVPTTTGAAIATTKVIPSLKNKFDGMAIRVPSIVGSLVDVTYIVRKKTDEKEVNKVFKKASRSAGLKNYVEASDEFLVSSDIIGNPHSSIVDLQSTKVLDGKLLKVISWYDNEWGYSNRLVDLALYMKKKRYV